LRSIEFTQPIGTLAVSMTGGECGLKCRHCGGHYLKDMSPAAEALQIVRLGREGRYSSCLISGGCDSRGRVPVLGDTHLLGALKAAGLRLNFHTGLVTEAEAAEIGKWADCVSFDLVGDDETVSEVFGLHRVADDYVRSYEALRRHARVVPHVCVGLRGGAISGEYRVVDYLAGSGDPPDQVVFIVLIPTSGTVYENRTPPHPEEVAALVLRARDAMPAARITLGCMRPAGEYRSRLDVLCLKAGADRVVNPSRDAREYASRNGCRVTTTKECCVF